MAQSRGLRKRLSWWLALFALLTGVLLFVLLRKSSRPESASRETRTTGAEVQRDAGAPLIGAANPACASHVDCAEGALCTRGRCEPITSATTECRDAMIRFARGTAELSQVAQLAVERAARCFKSNREPTLSIERSRDPFRSEQANEELTKARASTVRQALEERGVEPERLNAIGERR